MNVLLLHSDAALRAHLESLLGSRGHAVDAAADATAAERAFRDSHQPLVIAGGTAASSYIDSLRQHHPAAPPFILALSSDSADDDAALLAVGADDVLAESASSSLFMHRISLAEWLAECGAERPADNVALLEEVARATAEFVSDDPLEESLQRAMAVLGQAVDADHVWTLRHHPHSQSGKVAFSQLASWAADGAPSPIDETLLQDVDYRAAGLDRWLDAMLAGQVIQGIVSQLSAREQSYIVPLGIRSLFAMPIVADGETWGVIGFDDCRRERQWAPDDTAAFRLVALAIGRAIERARSREAIREGEDRYRGLLEQVNDIVYRHDLDGNYVDVNERGAALLGYTREEFCRLRVGDLVDESSTAVVDDMWDRKLAGQESVTRYELVARHKDGSKRRIYLSTRLVHENGEPVAVEGVAQDITERRAVEEALQESERRNRALLEAFPDLVIRIHADGTVLDYRPGNEARVLKRAGDAIGRNVRDLASSAVATRRMELVARAIKTGRVQVHNYSEDPGEPGNGALHFESLIVASGTDEAVIFARDVTVRREAARRLEEAAAEAEALYDFGERLRTASDVDEVCRLALETLQRVCGTDRASVRLTSDDDSLVFAASSGISETYMRVIESLTRRPVEERIRIPLAFNDTRDGTDHVSLQEPMQAEGVLSYIGVAMIASDTGEQVGQCSVYYSEPGHATDDRIRLVQTVAGTTALAISGMRAAEATRESEARFRTIFDAAPEAVAVIRLADRTFLDVNERFFAFSGYPAEEVIGRRWEDLTIIPDTEAVRDIVQRLAVLPSGLTSEVEYRHRSGEMRLCVLTVRLVQVGGEDCILTITRDITEEKREKEELARLAAIVESTDAAVVATSKDGIIVSANEGVRSVYGYTPAELVGRQIYTLIPEDAREEDTRAHQLAVAGQPVATETVRLTADGRRVNVSLSLFPVDDRSGNRLGYASIARDITDRKRFEAEMTRLAAAVESSEDAIFTFELDGTVASWNRGAQALFGFTPGELLGTVPIKLIPEDHAREAWACWVELVGTGKNATFDTVRLARDGSRVDVSYAASEIVSPQGERIGYVAVARDITERKRADAEIARLASVVESSSDAIITCSTDGVVTSWNAGAERLFGYANDEIVGRSILKILPGEDRDEAATVSAERLYSGNPLDDRDLKRLHKDGHLVDVSVTTFPIFDAEGNVTALASIARDITERKRVESEMARLAAAVASSDDAIIGSDLKGYITFANPGATAVYGFEREEMIGKPLSIFHPDDRTEEGIQLYRAAVKEGRAVALETIRLHADGRRLDIAISVFPIRMPDGEIVGLASISRDITERKRVESEVARLAAVVDSSADAIIGSDLRGNVTFANEGTKTVYGLDPGGLIGKPLSSFHPPGHDEEGARLFRAAVRDGQTLNFETKRLHADGRAIDVAVSLFPIRMPDGKVVGAASISRDITERKRAEADIARLAAVVGSSGDAIVTYDMDSVVTTWNAASERIFGFSAEEMIGNSLIDLLPAHERERARSETAPRIVAGEIIGPRDVKRLNRQGETIDVSIITFPITDSGGEILGVASIARDISERKAAEDEISRLAAVVGSSSDAIYVSAEQGMMVWNAAAERLFGYSFEEIRPLGAMPLVPADDLAATNATLERLQTGQFVPTRETVRLAKSGERIDVSISWFAVHDAEGNIAGAGAIARDIREKKAAEAQIARLAAVVESSDDAIYVENDEGVVAWNAAAGELFGYTFDEIQQLGILALVPVDATEDREQTERILEQVRTGEQTPPREAVRVAKNGDLIGVSVSWFPVRNSSGDVIGVGAIARDIRQKKAAEAALRQAEERLRTIVTNSPIAVFAVNAEGVITFYEGSGLGAAGFDPAQLVGVPLRRLRRVMPHIVSNSERALAGESFTSLDPVGDFVYETHHTPMRGEDGAVIGFYGVSVDITERVRAEAARRDAEALMHSVTGNMPIVVWAADDQQRVVFVEGTSLASMDLNREMIIGRTVEDITPHDPGYAAAAQRAIDGEKTLYRISLNSRTFDMALSPWLDADGESRGVIGAGVDITERLESEHARQQVEALLRNVAANAPVGLVALDASGKILLAEGKAIETMGFSTADIQGRSILDLVPVHERLREDIAEIRPGDKKLYEFEYQERHYAVHVTGIEAEPGDPAIVGVLVDVTDRARAEEALLQAQKLESLAVLAGGIAHDFNNLLVGILGNAGLALAELHPESPARETIEDIETAGRRAAELARQMLAYSGKGRFVIQSIDFSVLVGEMTHLLRAYTHKAVMRFDLADGLPAVEVDPTQLRQVVMNLVINAADAIGDEDGVISVRTGLMQADAAYLSDTYLYESQEPGDYVFFEVVDTGHGMSPDTLARIFDPFFTTKFTGKGLGLAAVLGIIRSHRGAIRVESTVGEGTTFRLLLPVVRGAAVAAPSATAPAGRWRGTGTVLVVDDEDSVRLVASRALKTFGFDVIDASDGQEGLDRFDAHDGPFVAALIDVTMPRMGGHALLQALRERVPGLPVVIMSGYHEQDAVKDVTSSGEAHFVQKPFDIPTLRDALREVIEGDERD